MINTFVHLMIQNKKKMFRLSNTARKIFWVAQIFDATLSNFTNGRAIAPPAPLSPTPMQVTLSLKKNKKLCKYEILQTLFQPPCTKFALYCH